jgi:hypothetical protein
MAEYTLTNTAAVVDASIQKVANADTTPTDSSPNMVTSGGVKAYVDTQDTALETQILANTAAIASSGPKTATLTAANGSKDYNDNSAYFYIPFTEHSDLNDIISVSSGVVTLRSAGTYLISINGTLQEGDGDPNDFWVAQVKKGSSVIKEVVVNEGTVDFNYTRAFVVANTTTTFRVTFYRSSRPSDLTWSGFNMSVVKLS